MEVKVIKAFRDKHTKNIHKVDDKLTISKKRFSELTTGPLGVFVEEIKEEVPPQIEKTEGTSSEEKPEITEAIGQSENADDKKEFQEE